MLRVARFLHGYLRPAGTALTEDEVTLEVDGEQVPATLLRPASSAPLPGWIALHGMTVPGRHHPALLRFCRALAASGGAVLIPEVLPWRQLRIDPEIADRTIAGAARFLARQPYVRPGGVAVVGFSFGATQALVTASRPELRGVLRSVVGFGGYCDLERTLRFMMLGEHEWQGETHRLDPDPYGRWIVAANYLTAIPELTGMEAVADAARTLATEAGQRWVYAGDPEYDPFKATLRSTLSRAQQEIWDLVAPPSDRPPPHEPTRELTDRLVRAALMVHPALDPRPALATLDRRVVLAHGYRDHLVPFTETLRLRDQLTAAPYVSATITQLFAHSRGAEGLRKRQYPVEAYRYLRLLSRALR